MKPAHTPGPWILEETYGANSRTACVRAQSWGVVASVGLDPSLPHWDGPQRANARLIAVSPAMFDVLQAIEHALRTGISAAQVLDENSPIRDAMRDAIAKATGEASE